MSPKQGADKKKAAAQGARGAVGVASAGLRETHSADLMKKHATAGRQEKQQAAATAAAAEEGGSSGLARHNSLPALPKKRAVSGGATRAATYSFAKNDTAHVDNDDDDVDADTDNQLLNMVQLNSFSPF